MLACARIGAIHSVIFTGFSAEALAHRIDDAQCKVLLAQDAISRGGRRVDLLKIVKDAAAQASSLEQVLLYTLDADLDTWPEKFSQRFKKYRFWNLKLLDTENVATNINSSSSWIHPYQIEFNMRFKSVQGFPKY